MSDIKIWRYSIPPTDSIEGWGIFLLDSTGMFAAVTDYGNYAFKWTHHGMPDFRQFVIDLANSPDYLLKKVAPNGEIYDEDKTVKGIKEHILRYRREGYYTKEFAKQEWDLINELVNENQISSQYEFYRCWYEKTEIEDAHEFEKDSYPADCIAFATKLIPRLADVLREGLRKETA